MSDKNTKAADAAETSTATADEKSKVDGKIVKLHGGRKALVMRPMGETFMRAQRMAKHPSEIITRMIAMVTTIDGEKITLNDLRVMDASDLMKLTARVAAYHDDDDEDEDKESEDDFLSQPQST